jgi:L-iditol 2-dehydrogenase
MRTVSLTGIRRLELREVPDPEIRASRDVLIRVDRVGICGSDIHYYAHGRIGSQVVRYPFTVGHECAGTVAAVGDEVQRVRPGDRVAIEPAMSCGTCDQCRAGRAHTCRQIRFLGAPGQAEGGLSELLVVSEESCYPVAHNTTLDQAALSEPFSIGVYSVQLCGPLAGARIGILGVGPIGLAVLAAARAAGIARAYVTDLIDGRLRVAREQGATWVGNPHDSDVVARILTLEPLGLDAVFECCGKQEAVDQAVDLMKPGGKLMMVGIPAEDRVSMAIDVARRKEICFQNVRRQNDCVQSALDLLESRRVNLDFMVTHRFPLERAAEAFDVVAGYKDGVIKAIIELT